MNLPNLRRGERIEVAAAQMIVMRAHDYIFVGLARQPGENIIDRSPRRLDVNLYQSVKTLREVKGSGLGTRVDLFLNLLQRFSQGLEPRFGCRVLHLDKEDANIFRPAHAAEASQQIF